MSKKIDDELLSLLVQAEAQRMCLFTEDKRLRAALGRRAWGTCTSIDVVKPFQSIFARRSYWEGLNPTERTLHTARALAVAHPAWIFSHFTAAVLYGWDVSYALQELLHVAFPYHYRGYDSEKLIRHTQREVEFEKVSGVRVTSPLQTLFDCLSSGGLRQGLPIADSALRSGLVDLDGAMHAFENEKPFCRKRGCRAVIDTMSHADPRSESGGESIARATMIELGFECPDLQVEFEDPLNPGKKIRVDFRWKLKDGTQILGELDGKQKYTDAALTGGRDAIEFLTAERLRESRLSITGSRIMRFSFSDVCDPIYFSALLNSFGVPRVRNARTNLSALHSLRSSGPYDELPPLSSYEDILAEYEPPRPRGGCLQRNHLRWDAAEGMDSCYLDK